MRSSQNVRKPNINLPSANTIPGNIGWNYAASLPDWSEDVKTTQADRIGKSIGVHFVFSHDIRNASGKRVDDDELWVFTTSTDTIMGVTFCTVAPEYSLTTFCPHRESISLKRPDNTVGNNATYLFPSPLPSFRGERLESPIPAIHPLTRLASSESGGTRARNSRNTLMAPFASPFACKACPLSNSA